MAARLQRQPEIITGQLSEGRPNPEAGEIPSCPSNATCGRSRELERRQGKSSFHPQNSRRILQPIAVPWLKSAVFTKRANELMFDCQLEKLGNREVSIINKHSKIFQNPQPSQSLLQVTIETKHNNDKRSHLKSAVSCLKTAPRGPARAFRS